MPVSRVGPAWGGALVGGSTCSAPPFYKIPAPHSKAPLIPPHLVHHAYRVTRASTSLSLARRLTPLQTLESRHLLGEARRRRRVAESAPAAARRLAQLLHNLRELVDAPAH